MNTSVVRRLKSYRASRAFSSAVSVTVAILAVLLGLVTSQSAAGGAPVASFNAPIGVSSDGTDVWVANGAGNNVTELDASTGDLVQLINGSQYGFDEPWGVSSDGTHVWVTNANGNSVTELDASTGALVQVIQGPQYGFDQPFGVSSDGTHVWVANSVGYSVTELDASTGALVQVIDGSADGLSPYSLSSDGTHVWVANDTGDDVTELDAATGALVQVIEGPDYAFENPVGISSDGTHVWVADDITGVTELDASTGAFIQTFEDPDEYGFCHPGDVSSDGTDVWITNTSICNYVDNTVTLGDSVTELNASTGALVQVIIAPQYAFNPAGHVSSDGSHVWVTNGYGNSVTEIDASTGALVQVIPAPSTTTTTASSATTSTSGPENPSPPEGGSPPGAGSPPLVAPTTATTAGPATTTTTVPFANTTAAPTTSTSTTTVPATRAKSGSNKPAIKALTSRATLSEGYVPLALGCSQHSCKGSITLWYRNVQAGKAAYSLPTGERAVFDVALKPKAAERLVKANGHALLFTQTVTVTGGTTVKKVLRLLA